MDESFAVDANHNSNLTAFETKNRSASFSSINEGIKAGQQIAKISVIALISIGIVELIIGHISGSVVATADGIDSLSDTMISFIVYMGLRIADRPPDRNFHFGYYKVESFAALIAAIAMVIIGSIILYHSYNSLLHKSEIHQPILTMGVLGVASIISLYRSARMRDIANKYNILSLKADAKNSIKDGSASVIAFVSVLIATHLGVSQMDAIGGIIIAGYIFSVSYTTLKQSSLILVDSWQKPKVTNVIKEAIEEKFREDQIKIRSVLLRPAGMVIFAVIHVEIEGNKRLADVELLSLQVEMEIRSRIPSIKRVSVIPHALTGRNQK